jgi:hypothetical protein
MPDEIMEALEDTPAAAFGLGVAATLLVSGIALRAAHGTLAVFALSAAIVWLAASLDHGGTRLEVLAFGVAVGIGGWQSLPTLFCSTLACAWLLLRWPAVERRRSFLLLAAVGFLLGTLPRTVFHSPSPTGLHAKAGVRAVQTPANDADREDEDVSGGWEDGDSDSGSDG